jgi:citrate lyase subunit alpha/citrate CoA-transferase
MINSVGRELPEVIEGYGVVKPYTGLFTNSKSGMRKETKVKSVKPGITKRLDSIEAALDLVEICDGMTLSFHHHLRNGDAVLNRVVSALANRGIKDLTLAISSIFPVHGPLVAMMKEGVVTGIVTNYMSGPVAKSISQGVLKKPVVMMTHGGRPRAIESGELKIDVAFIAAPASDDYGNCNGVGGKSACGALGYAVSDAQYAEKVVVITDHLVDYPAMPIEISQQNVDYVVLVDSIGDPSGIVSGTTQVTRDPVGLKIAHYAAEVIKASGLLKNGLSFQTGAGGTSLAVAAELKDRMRSLDIVGSFASGGITGYLVDMLEEGLFNTLLDVQCFDLKAVQSYRDNPKHMAMDASMYANPSSKGAVVNQLDVMILGATEVDLDFNVNVTTGSDGMIIGGSGGHSDTAAGSKLTIVVANLVKTRMPIVKRHIMTITTPGESIDVIVTERGIAVNPLRQDLLKAMTEAGLPVVSIEALLEMAEAIAGVPHPVQVGEDIVAVVQYRDGTVIDVVRKIEAE